MDNLYPQESQNLNFIGHLEELRRRLFVCLGFFVLASVVSFANGTFLIRLIERPAAGLIREWIFITPTEVFASYLKVSFLTGFIFSFPVLLYEAWQFFAPAFGEGKKNRAAAWMILALVCFILGVLFAYFIAIPAALKFLINFGKDIAVPYITLNRYVSFFGALTLTGGLVFEVPVVIILLADVGLLKTATLKTKRPYAYLGIFVVAAVVTPTQDIVNMLIFALPMILLFELGLFLAGIVERARD